jgi:outer membrane protein
LLALAAGAVRRHSDRVLRDARASACRLLCASRERLATVASPRFAWGPCFLLALALVPLRAGAEDLLEIYRQALQNDALFGQARASHQAGLELAPQGRAGLLPAVGLSASTTKYDQEVKTTATNNYDYHTDSYSLSLTQPIYRKPNFAAAAQGEHGAAQAEHDFLSAQHDLLQRVTRAYLDVLAAEDALEYATAEKNAIERLGALTRRNFSVGTATLVDVHDTQAAYDLAVAAEIAAQNDLATRREALRVLTGVAPGRLARLKEPFKPVTPQPADPDKWVETAAESNPQIKSAQEAYEVAAQELERSRGGHHPTLDLTAAHTYTDAGGSVQGFASESTTNQVGLVFQLPLYAGGFTSSKVRETYARREQAAQRLDQTRRSTAQQAREAYTTVLSGRARVNALDQALVSNQRALESTLLGYERGLRNGQDVLNNQRNLFRTRRDLSQARYDYLFSGLRLKAAAGTLGEQDLGEINSLLAQ